MTAKLCKCTNVHDALVLEPLNLFDPRKCHGDRFPLARPMCPYPGLPVICVHLNSPHIAVIVKINASCGTDISPKSISNIFTWHDWFYSSDGVKASCLSHLDIWYDPHTLFYGKEYHQALLHHDSALGDQKITLSSHSFSHLESFLQRIDVITALLKSTLYAAYYFSTFAH